VASPQPSSELVGPSEAWSGGMPDGGVGGELGWLGSKTRLNMRDGIRVRKMCPSAARRFSCARWTAASAQRWSRSASHSSRKAAR
jgi:hypothetical protein